jgi:hypothetical protein
MLRVLISMIVPLLMMVGCVEPRERKVACSPDIIMAPLPQKCGEYTMEYGTVTSQGFLLRLKDKQAVYLLDGFDSNGIVGKEVAIAGKYWPQYIGGVLKEDGSNTGSYLIRNLLKPTLVQVAGEKGFDKCWLYEWCAKTNKER